MWPLGHTFFVSQNMSEEIENKVFNITQIILIPFLATLLSNNKSL